MERESRRPYLQLPSDTSSMNGQAVIVFLQSDCATEVPLLESFDCSMVCARHVCGIAATVDENYDFSIGIVSLLTVVAVDLSVVDSYLGVNVLVLVLIFLVSAAQAVMRKEMGDIDSDFKLPPP